MKIIKSSDVNSSNASNYPFFDLIRDRLDVLVIKITNMSKSVFKMPIINKNDLKSKVYTVLNYASSLKNSALDFAKQFHKKRKYELSLLYTLSRNYFNKDAQPWMSKINDNIYLGGILLKKKNHIKMLKDNNIGSVLSLLENFEYTKTIFSTPITKKDLDKAKIKLLQIEAKDFILLTFKEIDTAVKFLKDEIEKNTIVYVHCKAGKGRSVTAVCCYLIAEKKFKADKAIEYVRDRRCNINLSKHQIAQIYNYQKEIENRKNTIF